MMKETYSKKSKVNKISFYKDFKCIGGACPMSCCKGWRVPIDDEKYYKYISEKGIFGLKLQLSIEKKDDVVSFKKYEKGCPFWTKEHLCGLQEKYGEVYMPKVCIDFPRRKINYGDFAEETLYLSCPEASRLMVYNINNLVYEQEEEIIHYENASTNEDYVYLRRLVDIRGQIIDRIIERDGALGEYTRDLFSIFTEISDFATRAQEACIGGIAIPSFDTSNHIQKLAQSDIFQCLNEGTGITGIEKIDKVMTGGFYHRKLRENLPLLYKLCRVYFKEFDDLSIADADKKLEETIIKVCQIKLEKEEQTLTVEEVLRGYYVYYLETSFLEVFETYSFRRVLLTGMIHVYMIALLLGMYQILGNPIDKEAVAHIIALYERRGRHNDDILQTMYETLQDKELNK